VFRDAGVLWVDLVERLPSAQGSSADVPAIKCASRTTAQSGEAVFLILQTIKPPQSWLRKTMTGASGGSRPLEPFRRLTASWS
jgi:hypothetical protein